jgi:plastocyanin
MMIRTLFQVRVSRIALLLLTASAGRALASGGTITGEVIATPAKFRSDVVVHLGKVEGEHKPPAAPVTLDQKGLRFVPRVLAVMKGTTVRFLNSDSVAHNVFTPDGETYNLGSWPKGESKNHAFNQTGAYVQLCHIHPEMIGYVVVVDSPYFAVTDANGKFQIDHVPPGTYTVHAWSERLPEVTQSVTVAAGSPTSVHIEIKR